MSEGYDNSSNKGSRKLIFGKLPLKPIYQGLLPMLTEAQTKVYLAIAAHFRGDPATPSISSLMRLTDKSRATVCRALTRLKDLGAITIIKGVGETHPNQYSLSDSLTIDETISGRQIVSNSTPDSLKNRVQIVSNSTPDSLTQMRRASNEEEIEEIVNRQQQKGPDAAVGEIEVEIEDEDQEKRRHAGMLELLAKLRIGNPTRTRLADRVDLYPLHVAVAWRKTKGKTGLTIHLCKTDPSITIKDIAGLLNANVITAIGGVQVRGGDVIKNGEGIKFKGQYIKLDALPALVDLNLAKLVNQQ